MNPVIVMKALDHVIAEGARHYVPVRDLYRSGRFAIWLLGQSVTPFNPTHRLPCLTIIGDDPPEPDRALGPGGFHADSIRRVLAASRGIVILACAAEPAYYAAATAGAFLGGNYTLIETRMEQEIPWYRFATAAAPTAAFLIGTVKGGTA